MPVTFGFDGEGYGLVGVEAELGEVHGGVDVLEEGFFVEAGVLGDIYSW